MAKTVLAESRLPRAIWAWVAQHTAAVVSVCTTKKNSSTAVSSHTLPSLARNLSYSSRILGVLCNVKQRKDTMGGKLLNRSLPAIYLGKPPGERLCHARGRMCRSVSRPGLFPHGVHSRPWSGQAGLCPRAQAQRHAASDGNDWLPEDHQPNDSHSVNDL